MKTKTLHSLIFIEMAIVAHQLYCFGIGGVLNIVHHKAHEVTDIQMRFNTHNAMHENVDPYFLENILRG